MIDRLQIKVFRGHCIFSGVHPRPELLSWRFINEFGPANKIQNLPAFEVRIGIHTGPVVAGVVGLKKFAYDIWGDTVDLASRMEQHSEAGKVNVSRATYQLIKNYFWCTYRGRIETKSKPDVEMYFVDEEISAA